MKKIGLRSLIGIVFILLVIFSNGSFAQNAIVGTGFTGGWATTGDFEYLTGSAGTSYIKTDVAIGTGNQYFRMGVDWGSTKGQHTVTISSDVEVTPNNEIALNSTSTGSGAMFLNVTSTSHNYIFKTKDAGSTPSFNLILFKVEGTVRSVSGVSKDLSTVYRGQTVTVTATLDGSFNAGQGVYLRYTNDNFAASTVVVMTGSGTSYSAAIPSVTNTANSTVKYYVFTSGSGLTLTGDKADWYTINLNNNSGNNYSYVVNSSFISKSSGLWSSTSTWAGDQIPSSGGAVILDNNVTLDQAASVSTLTINAGKTFTASDNSPRTLTITKSTAGSSTTLSNSGTWANGTGGSTVVFTGAPSSGDAVHAISGTIAFQNITVNKTGGSSNVGVSFGANSSVSGTLEIGTGGFVSTAPPTSFYSSGAILKFNQGSEATYDVNSGDYSWSSTVVPNYITISSGTVNLNTERTASGDLIIDNGKLAIFCALTVSGSITNSAGASGLVIKSDASGTGSLKTSSSPAATVERYLTNYSIQADDKYHFISSPVVSQAIQPDFVASTPLAGVDFYKFSESTNEWINSKTAANVWNSGFESSFVVGRGYMVAYPTIPETPKTFVGDINSYPAASPLILTCTNTDGEGNGWNLLGNPFPSAIDWTLVSLGNGMDNALYYYDAAEQNYNYYLHLTGETGALGSGQQYIPAMQGFMVHAKTTGTKTVTFDNDDRTHNGQSVYYKSTNTLPGSWGVKNQVVA